MGSILTTSVFHAPRRWIEKWRARRALGRWREPGGSILLYCAVDFNSGVSRIYLRSREGKNFWAENAYLEIVEPERIVFRGTLQSPVENLKSSEGTMTFRRTDCLDE